MGSRGGHGPARRVRPGRAASSGSAGAAAVHGQAGPAAGGRAGLRRGHGHGVLPALCNLQQVRGLSALRVSAIFLLAAPAAVTAGPLAGRLIGRFGVRSVLAAGLGTAAGLLLLSFLSAPYAGLLIFPFGTGLAFSAALVTTMQDVGAAQAGLAGAMVNTAMETGPPLGLAAPTGAAAYSRDPAAGYLVALRTAAILLPALALFITAVSTTISRHPRRPEEEK